MKTFIFWNPEKVSGNTTLNGYTCTVGELQTFEAEESISISSTLSLVDEEQAKAFVEAVLCEGDLELRYAEIIDFQKLLSVMECLIDTVQSTTDLENVYDDSKEQSFSWQEVMEQYQVLKVLAKVE
jgi:hypothetical protein